VNAWLSLIALLLAGCATLLLTSCVTSTERISAGAPSQPAATARSEPEAAADLDFLYVIRRGWHVDAALSAAAA
jgi:hypothetical protein